MGEKDTQIARVQAAANTLAEERDTAVRLRNELETGFMERLQVERDKKEQELLKEVASLRKAGEAKDKRLKEATSAKVRLAQRETARVATTELSDAHRSIAKAFGDLSAEHPCTRLFDEPMLKLTSLLFRQSHVRRVVFVSSAFIWLFTLIHALTSHM